MKGVLFSFYAIDADELQWKKEKEEVPVSVGQLNEEKEEVSNISRDFHL